MTLTCEQVGHRFGRQWLFSKVQFALSGRGSICITGPNGSGKSTLMRILAGLLEPVAGRATWTCEGKTLSILERNRTLGFVSPDVHLYGELSVLENLRFFQDLRGLEFTAGHLENWLVRFGLEREGHKRYAMLSSGQKQRMKFLQALLHEPPVLFLDEPTANLDSAGRSLVADVVALQKKRGLLVVATNEEEEYGFGETQIRVG